MIEWDWGHPREATRHHTRVLDISRELGWPLGEAAALGVGGCVEWSLARLDGALERLTVGMRIVQETGNRYSGRSGCSASV
ncbi:hypothetical protein E4K10_20635 [Streptomyces sp. T1317-0309]|nr:hypothetical protein E4K10_20635 [Streptomyces sp. T1317-0309]